MDIYDKGNILDHWDKYKKRKDKLSAADKAMLGCAIELAAKDDQVMTLREMICSVFNMLSDTSDVYLNKNYLYNECLYTALVGKMDRDRAKRLVSDLAVRSRIMEDFFKFLYSYGQTLPADKQEKFIHLIKRYMRICMCGWGKIYFDYNGKAKSIDDDELCEKDGLHTGRKSTCNDEPSKEPSRDEDTSFDKEQQDHLEALIRQMCRERRSKTPKLNDIVKILRRRYRGQDDAVREVSTILYEFMVQSDGKHGKRRSRTILLTGPTGTGKTYLADQMASILNAQILKFKASDLTTNGFKGQNVSVIGEAIEAMASEKGVDPKEFTDCVLFLDEFDKVITPTYTSQGENVNRLIQGQILAYLEEYPILCVCSGCFDEIRKDKAKKTKEQSLHIGFSAAQMSEGPAGEVPESPDVECEVITREDLERAGGIRELLGRINRVINLQPLGREDLKDILMHAEESALEELCEKMKYVYGVRLVLEEDAADLIAEKASESGCGARALRQILDGYIYGRGVAYELGMMEDERPEEIHIRAEHLIKGCMPVTEYS